MHGEQPLFVDGTFGLAAKFGMSEAQFGEGNRRGSDIGIGNRLITLGRG
jgi:hypothetical protein